jgi:hypothetical protein
MSNLKFRLSAIERAYGEHDFTVIRVNGLVDDFFGCDPFNPLSRENPQPGESADAYEERVQREAIAAGKSQVAIFGQPHYCGSNSN